MMQSRKKKGNGGGKSREFPCDGWFSYHVKKNGRCVYHGNCSASVYDEADYVKGKVCDFKGQLFKWY